MGLTIVTVGRPPATMILHLACDMPRCHEHGRFVAECEETGRGFVELHAEAMAAGWLERFNTRPPEGRLFLCPSCSGKEPKSDQAQKGLDL